MDGLPSTSGADLAIGAAASTALPAAVEAVSAALVVGQQDLPEAVSAVQPPHSSQVAAFHDPAANAAAAGLWGCRCCGHDSTACGCDAGACWSCKPCSSPQGPWPACAWRAWRVSNTWRCAWWCSSIWQSSLLQHTPVLPPASSTACSYQDSVQPTCGPPAWNWAPGSTRRLMCRLFRAPAQPCHSLTLCCWALHSRK